MSIIRKGKYDSAVIKRWLDANGVRWYIPEDAEIIIKGKVAYTERMLIRLDDMHNLRRHNKDYDRRVLAYRDGEPVDVKTKPYKFRVRYPIGLFR